MKKRTAKTSTKSPRRKRFWFDPRSLDQTQQTTDPELASALAAYSGQPTGFENDEFFWDYVYWLPDEQLRDPALRAVVEADKLDNDQPITTFINSGRTISNQAQHWFDDWYERHEPGKRGKKPTPAYALSLQDSVYALIKMRAQTLRQDAIYRIDKGEKLTPVEKQWLADNDRTVKDDKLTVAKRRWLTAIDRGIKLKAGEARWLAALEYYIDPNKFEKWYQGRTGGTRRMEKRRRGTRK